MALPRSRCFNRLIAFFASCLIPPPHSAWQRPAQSPEPHSVFPGNAQQLCHRSADAGQHSPAGLLHDRFDALGKPSKFRSKSSNSFARRSCSLASSVALLSSSPGCLRFFSAAIQPKLISLYRIFLRFDGMFDIGAHLFQLRYFLFQRLFSCLAAQHAFPDGTCAQLKLCSRRPCRGKPNPFFSQRCISLCQNKSGLLDLARGFICALAQFSSRCVKVNSLSLLSSILRSFPVISTCFPAISGRYPPGSCRGLDLLLQTADILRIVEISLRSSPISPSVRTACPSKSAASFLAASICAVQSLVSR